MNSAEILKSLMSKGRMVFAGLPIGVVALGLIVPATADAADVETLKPGILVVTVQPYMPYTALKDDKLVGLDSDILAAVAEKLGLKLEVNVTDFPGMLASVQNQRADITIGGIAWSEARQKVGLFTDPPYYSPPAMAVAGEKTFSDVKSLEGKNLGTVTGYVWAKSIALVPNATPRTFPGADSVFQDLATGRLDVGFLDPLLITYQQQQRPDMKVRIEYMTPPTKEEIAAHPDYKYFQSYMTGFYLPKQAPKLEKAISAQIDAMYRDGSLAALITKWGGDPKQFLVPSPEMAAARRGIDRPADWTPPSVAK
ncbi:transporter substrate-binding domain-containing protein [Agrobacterium vitis]|uniref:Amino acid ABC transporter substrate-binding protein n=2 Tax=Agrobacterium vitis TaxID=373 RepID=A0A368NMT6_AGRVI|nr:transporter substrate-binding domain-containing protein [Agrobacterium vitis]KAA3507785.1 amino acid ABC transporter substrate-binding protein [Agrobacterium vitis]KAA3522238.1 amino acid ABC transporter substrate-binding protein [Agrobacterium vitis]MCF1480474.1 amino acid ABC transporter substrate-binding protein [Agrobacterium vitis]MUZ75754.1 transporter substrate-binding domain-containing protein [Agrobacterium vitis]MUZ98913.1 transporter substrate-binding domain-containing protein [A